MRKYQRQSNRSIRLVAIILLIAFSAILVWLLLFKGDPRQFGTIFSVADANARVANLKFGKTILMFYDMLIYGPWHYLAFLNLAGNVAVTIPLGILWSLASNGKYTFIKTMLGSLILITLIEVLQYYTALGVLDVDDFVLNMLGAFIGWLFMQAVNRLSARPKRRSAKS